MGPDRLLHRMSRMCEILFARDSNIVLRSSLDMWFSQKQRLRSVSSGKEVLWCGERLGSGFRSDSGEYEFFFEEIYDRMILQASFVKLLLQVRVKRMDGLPAQFYRS